MPLSSLRNSFRRKNKPQKLKVTEDWLSENSQDKQAQVRSFCTCLGNAEICKLFKAVGWLAYIYFCVCKLKLAYHNFERIVNLQHHSNYKRNEIKLRNC